MTVHEKILSFLITANSYGLSAKWIGRSTMGICGITFSGLEREVDVEFYKDGTAHCMFSNTSKEEVDATEPLPDNPEEWVRFIRKITDYLEEV